MSINPEANIKNLEAALHGASTRDANLNVAQFQIDFPSDANTTLEPMIAHGLAIPQGGIFKRGLNWEELVGIMRNALAEEFTGEFTPTVSSDSVVVRKPFGVAYVPVPGAEVPLPGAEVPLYARNEEHTIASDLGLWRAMGIDLNELSPSVMAEVRQSNLRYLFTEVGHRSFTSIVEILDEPEYIKSLEIRKGSESTFRGFLGRVVRTVVAFPQMSGEIDARLTPARSLMLAHGTFGGTPDGILVENRDFLVNLCLQLDSLITQQAHENLISPANVYGNFDWESMHRTLTHLAASPNGSITIDASKVTPSVVSLGYDESEGRFKLDFNYPYWKEQNNKIYEHQRNQGRVAVAIIKALGNYAGQLILNVTQGSNSFGQPTSCPLSAHIGVNSQTLHSFDSLTRIIEHAAKYYYSV